MTIAFHTLVIFRELWKHCTHPGTFRGLLRATLQWVCGKGWSFQWPASAVNTEAATRTKEEAIASTRVDNWYVGEKDLAFFKYRAIEDGPCEGCSKWEIMFEKDLPGFLKYTAWRRTTPSGVAEYKSITVCPDATAEEFMDMYLDDDFRRNWDGMVIHHEVLEHGDFSQRQQVVRWVRRFPFSFLSDREYTQARRFFKEDDTLYACTKSIANHPREVFGSNVVKMDDYWSMWRSRTIADPWGSDKPACETVLLHYEDFKIPERLARFAVRHGMWGFIRKLASTVPQYVAARRKRVPSYAADPQAYGAGCAPNPPMHHTSSDMSLCSMSSSCSTSDLASECGLTRESSRSLDDASVASAGSSASKRLRGMAALVVAGGVALAVGSAVAGTSDSAARLRHKEGVTRRVRRHHTGRPVPRVESFPILESLQDEE